MSEKTMADYLSSVTADYTTTELSINPHDVLVESGGKNQSVHIFSDGQRGVVTIGDGDSTFEATCLWNNLSVSDEGTIKDFFHDTGKAYGLSRSFYWQHPTDGNTYTVKFLSGLITEIRGRVPGRKSVQQLRLHVIGVKPA
jgi:hypothetical protein